MTDPTTAALGALTGGDARAWASAPLQGLDRVHVPPPVDGRLAWDGFGHNAAYGIALVLALHRLDDVDAAFAQARHMLRPAGTLVIVSPSVGVRSLADLRWRSALRPALRGPWRHRAALDGAAWLLAAADFAVLGDERVAFTLPLPDAEAAYRAVDELPAAGIWPELTPGVRVELAGVLAERAGPGCAMPVPLRRLVARR